jgi:hypothetical protein
VAEIQSNSGREEGNIRSSNLLESNETEEATVESSNIVTLQ